MKENWNCGYADGVNGLMHANGSGIKIELCFF